MRKHRIRAHRVTIGAVAAVTMLLSFASLTDAKRVEQVHLGGKSFASPNGSGWGTVRPHAIFNGGDPNGLVDHIHWKSWDGSVAYGTGLHSIFRPRGGYYRHRVVAILRASALGECEGRRAYTRLSIKEPRRPGGKLGPWYSWSGASNICEAPY